MAAGVYNTALDQGATFQRTFEINDADGEPIDLTGFTFEGQIRKKPLDSGTPIATFTCAQGAEVNELDISLTDTETSAIPVTADAKNPAATTKYYYDVEMTDLGGVVTRLVQGTIDVSPEVTK